VAKLAKDWLKEKAKLAKSGQSKMAKPQMMAIQELQLTLSFCQFFTSFQNPCKPFNPTAPPPPPQPPNK
jgi:hypothetical protein